MKRAILHDSVRETLREFPGEIRWKIGRAIFHIQGGNSPTMPLYRPMRSVAPGVSEIRVKDSSGAYRVFFLVVTEQGVLVFHAFRKKTEQTPQSEIELGRRRLREMLP